MKLEGNRIGHEERLFDFSLSSRQKILPIERRKGKSGLQVFQGDSMSLYVQSFVIQCKIKDKKLYVI